MSHDRATSVTKLPRGASALDREAVAAVHRQRLERAAFEVVARAGYGDATVADIARQAQVSTNAFYAQYRTKEECFLSGWDAAFASLAADLERASTAPPPPDRLDEALARVIAAFVHACAADPQRGRAQLVGVLAVGPDGPLRRRRVADELAQRLRVAQGRLTQALVVPDIALTVVAGGVAQVVEQRLRTTKPRWPRSLVADLTAWATAYATEHPLEPPAPDPRGHLREVPPEPAHLVRLPRGQNRLPRAFVAQHQRGRILHAVATIARDEGYAGVTVPEVAARAHISNRTFYEHFDDKREAFLAAFDAGFTRLFSRAFYAAATEADWAKAVREGFQAWVDFLAADPELARFGLSDVLTAAEAAPAVEAAYQAFAHLLAHGGEHAPAGREVPAIVPYALAGGIGALVRAWVLDGRAADLPRLAPLLCYLALAPFVGDSAASTAAAA